MDTYSLTIKKGGAIMETYTVTLNGGGITYSPSIYGCDYCGFTDTDKSYFTLIKGELYCSLHVGEAS